MLGTKTEKSKTSGMVYVQFEKVGLDSKNNYNYRDHFCNLLYLYYILMH